MNHQDKNKPVLHTYPEGFKSFKKNMRLLFNYLAAAKASDGKRLGSTNTKKGWEFFPTKEVHMAWSEDENFRAWDYMRERPSKNKNIIYLHGRGPHYQFLQEDLYTLDHTVRNKSSFGYVNYKHPATEAALNIVMEQAGFRQHDGTASPLKPEEYRLAVFTDNDPDDDLCPMRSGIGDHVIITTGGKLDLSQIFSKINNERLDQICRKVIEVITPPKDSYYSPAALHARHLG